jgi:arylsulfatase A-like enzyme
MGNTYVFFTSDNGWHEGEHRISFGKARPYEEGVRAPLLVRGPGVAAGGHAQKLALNTDYLPTFTDLAGAQTPGYADGRSLRPVFEGNATAWRSAVLLEARRTPEAEPAPGYRGVRTNGMKYIQYADGKRELYDLRADPHELRNLHTDPAYDEVEAVLANRLSSLRDCSADSCRTAEGP